MSRVVVNEIEAKVGNDITFNDTVKIDTLKGKTTAGSITVQGEGTATTNLQQGLAKGWCVFDGTGTIASADSFNFSSLTDNATGDYRVTMANDMSSINYAVSGTQIGATSSYYNSFLCSRGVPKNASSYRFTVRHEDGGANDMDVLNTIAHGDLA